ncbi:hypothetical protein N8A98_02125 (plasmid) [Devosia neptuniae]|uniref:Uncharacterized protein n=1 Tax=Devosia neptuniae TaxID=191302 RepID=A0ABY6C6F9_9HYPH|nr:hypothetical protein [Devosia neptuniae]UXN67878.1 hypothetical protein N8A98_02125 [Devosia neptuniae]
MIWFDAALESPVDDGLLRRCIATLLNIPSENVDVVHSLSKIKDAPATCVVEDRGSDSYSQLITVYVSESLPCPYVLDAAAQLARMFAKSLLLVDDATANPYSFVCVSSAGQHSVVLVDPNELDKNNRYVIREPAGGRC